MRPHFNWLLRKPPSDHLKSCAHISTGCSVNTLSHALRPMSQASLEVLHSIHLLLTMQHPRSSMYRALSLYTLLLQSCSSSAVHALTCQWSLKSTNRPQLPRSVLVQCPYVSVAAVLSAGSAGLVTHAFR